MIDPAVFRNDAVAEETKAFNAATREALAAMAAPFPPPSPQAYRDSVRQMFAAAAGGEIYHSPRARELPLPGHVKLRVIDADEPSGVYLHMHSGGWVIGGADLQDAALENLAAMTGQTVVSVEYRLAPEAPFPAALDDCEHAARWLADNAPAEFGVDRLTIGGESAGANLALATLLRLRHTPPAVPFTAGNLAYGAYDLSMTPSQRHTDSVIVTTEMLEWFSAQYVPDPTQRTNPEVSPLYADLRGLPPLLLTVGTADPVLDDTLFLYVRLLAANVPVEMQIMPGGDHSFDAAPLPIADQAVARMAEFLSRQPIPATAAG